VQYILDGVILGLTLTILLGPIFVALTQTGLQHGIRAGVAVGSGIWISDFLVIMASWLFIKQIDDIAKNPSFQYWTGIVGGCILILFGIISILNKHTHDEQTKAFSAKTYWGFFTKGFAVNFINPFTFVFWIGVMTSYVIGKATSGFNIFLLFASIMATIMTTDTLKVVLAKSIRTKMNRQHIILFSRIAGTLLIVFGIILFFRTGVL
jgi:threonine/homoserine/homoserine lactone efflux protein